jgi:hypothetical protein
VRDDGTIGLVTVSTERRNDRRAPLVLAALTGPIAELWAAVPAGWFARPGLDRFA